MEEEIGRAGDGERMRETKGTRKERRKEKEMERVHVRALWLRVPVFEWVHGYAGKRPARSCVVASFTVC